MQWKTVLVLVLVAAAATACGRKERKPGLGERLAEKALETAIAKGAGGNAKVDLKGETFTIKTDKGEFVAGGGGNVKIPDDFPKDVLVYGGAKPLTTMKTGEGFMLMLGTQDSVEKVLEAYKADMPSQGWKEEASMNMNGMSTISYKKDDRTANVMVGSGDEQTSITLTVTAPEG